MALRLYLSLVLVAAPLCLAEAETSQPDADRCRQQLTELDPHMGQYVGKT